MNSYKMIAAAAAVADTVEFDCIKIALKLFALPWGVAGEWRVSDTRDWVGGGTRTRTLYRAGRPVVRARSDGRMAWVTRTWTTEEGEAARAAGKRASKDAHVARESLIATLVAVLASGGVVVWQPGQRGGTIAGVPALRVLREGGATDAQIAAWEAAIASGMPVDGLTEGPDGLLAVRVFPAPPAPVRCLGRPRRQPDVHEGW